MRRRAVHFHRFIATAATATSIDRIGYQQQHGGTNDGGEMVKHFGRCVVDFESSSMLWKQVQSFKHTKHKSKTDMQIKKEEKEYEINN